MDASAKKLKIKFLPPVPIQMVDDTDENAEEIPIPGEQLNNTIESTHPSQRRQPLDTWASDVRIGDCTIVNGSGSQFAVWAVTVETNKGGKIELLKRYSEFDELRRNLANAFPDHVSEIPKLPPKKVFGNLKTDFLAKRRQGLEFFISCVLLNPVLANSDIVKKFVSTSARS